MLPSETKPLKVDLVYNGNKLRDLTRVTTTLTILGNIVPLRKDFVDHIWMPKAHLFPSLGGLEVLPCLPQ